MARIRTIKPQHCADKNLPKISLQAHLLWVLSWCFSDDKGVFENDPLLLKSQIFPRRVDIRTEQIVQWLNELEKARFIIPFTHNEQGYFIHRTFSTHQRIDKPQGSVIPDSVIAVAFQERSKNDTGMVPPVEESNSNGMEGNVDAQSAGAEQPPLEEKPPEPPADKKPPRPAPPPQFSYCVMPWDTDSFKDAWATWKVYKKEQHRFTYKGNHSEQAALVELSELSEGLEETALLIIRQSIAKGWSGLFKLKTDSNGKPNSKGRSADQSDYERDLANRLSASSGQGGYTAG